jgi:hypothetical protein
VSSLSLPNGWQRSHLSWVYAYSSTAWGSEQERSCLVQARETLDNQLGQPTQRPTLRACLPVLPGCAFTSGGWS